MKTSPMIFALALIVTIAVPVTVHGKSTSPSFVNIPLIRPDGGSEPELSIGTDGTTSRTGHMFSVSGSQVSAWHVNAGTATLTAHPTTQACPAFPGPGTCVSSTMDVAFNFSGSVAEGAATGQRVASGAVTDIPGVRLSQP